MHMQAQPPNSTPICVYPLPAAACTPIYSLMLHLAATVRLCCTHLYERTLLPNMMQCPGQFMGLRPYSAFSTSKLNMFSR